MKGEYIDNGRRFRINGTSYTTFLSNSDRLNPRLKKFIVKGDIDPPQGYIMSKTGKSILKVDDNKLVRAHFNKKNATKWGFKTLKEATNFYNSLKQNQQVPKTVFEFIKSYQSFKLFNEMSELKDTNPTKVRSNKFYIEPEKSKFNDYFLNIYNKNPYMYLKEDYIVYFHNIVAFLTKVLTSSMKKWKAVKFDWRVFITFYKNFPKFDENGDLLDPPALIDNQYIDEELSERANAYVVVWENVDFKLEQAVRLLHINNIPDKLDHVRGILINLIEGFINNGSGWNVKNVNYSTLHIFKHDAHKGGHVIKLDDFISNKKAVRNYPNNDNRCFFYALIIALHRDELNLKEYSKSLNDKIESYFDLYHFDDKDCPVEITPNIIKKYAQLIGKNINVFAYEHGSGDNPVPVFTTKYEFGITDEQQIDLLYYTIPEHKVGHYVCITRLSALIGSLLTSKLRNKKKNCRAKDICRNCCKRCQDFPTLEQHVKLCMNNETCEIKMSQHSHQFFTHVRNELIVPLKIYADSEALNGKHQVPSAFNFLSIKHKNPVKYYETTQENVCRAIEDFLDNLVEYCMYELDNTLKREFRIHWTLEQQHQHSSAIQCGRCKSNFTKRNPKVAHHCHYTEKMNFLGTLCNNCNLLLKKPRTPVIPVFFHNLSYDIRQILAYFKTKFDDLISIDAIPISTKKFISVSFKIWGTPLSKQNPKHHYQPKVIIRFLDSMRFLNSSLDTLSGLLTKEEKHFIMDLVEGDETKFQLLQKKGSFPYSYVNSFDKLDETQLPPVEEWVNSLKYGKTTWDECTESQQKEMKEMVEHSNLIWKEFKCKTIFDFQNVYMRNDTYLLACVFEQFIDMIIDKFGLDPCHYLTLPSMGNDAMLKFTNVKIELFQEDKHDMYLQLEDRVGGISTTGGISYAKANNKYLDDYDDSKPSTFIWNIDAVALYGKAMTEKLPKDGFKHEDVATFDLEQAYRDADGDKGYFLIVDAHLPNEYHDEQNDYPCFPETIEITEDMLSPFNKRELDILHTELGHTTKRTTYKSSKLSPNLKPKKNYLVHIKTLKLYTQLGWVIDKIHTVISFNQSAWLKPFVDYCSHERQKATSEFYKALWKLIPNSIYGKFLENLRNRMNIHFFTSSDTARMDKYRQKFNYKRSELIHENLQMIEMGKLKCSLNRPIHVGIAILQLSKHTMYNFFYNVIRKKYPTARLIYTDTDSLHLYIETEDLYQDIVNDKDFLDQFDLNDYDPNNPMFVGIPQEDIVKNKKIPGKFSDDNNGVVVREEIALKSKMYRIECSNNIYKNRAKGVPKVLQAGFTLNDYKNSHSHFHEWRPENMLKRQNTYNIHCDKNLKMSIRETNKVVFSSFNDKRYTLDDGVHSYAYGHWRIQEH
jgi:hypothetical protein